MAHATCLIHVEVVGRVQGVGFRAFVQEQARGLGAVGWVRNQPNGNVEVAAKLARHKANTLLLALRRGPAVAFVQRLNTLSTAGLVFDFANFQILE